jgi:hypothetical protein
VLLRSSIRLEASIVEPSDLLLLHNRRFLSKRLGIYAVDGDGFVIVLFNNPLVITNKQKENSLNRLVSPHSRMLFGVLLGVVALLGLGAGMAVEKDSYTLAKVLQVTVVVTLLVCMLYLIYVQPSIQDLVEEVQRRLEIERDSELEWAVTEIRKVSFKQMTWGERMLQGFMILTAIFIFAAGIGDLMGWVAPLRMKAANGTHQEIPQIASGLVFCGIAFVIFMVGSILRIRFVDRVDEELSKILKGGNKQVR